MPSRSHTAFTKKSIGNRCSEVFHPLQRTCHFELKCFETEHLVQVQKQVFCCLSLGTVFPFFCPDVQQRKAIEAYSGEKSLASEIMKPWGMRKAVRNFGDFVTDRSNCDTKNCWQVRSQNLLYGWKGAEFAYFKQKCWQHRCKSMFYNLNGSPSVIFFSKHKTFKLRGNKKRVRSWSFGIDGFWEIFRIEKLQIRLFLEVCTCSKEFFENNGMKSLTTKISGGFSHLKLFTTKLFSFRVKLDHLYKSRCLAWRFASVITILDWFKERALNSSLKVRTLVAVERKPSWVAVV